MELRVKANTLQVSKFLNKINKKKKNSYKNSFE
jgi:hypothetical protein